MRQAAARKTAKKSNRTSGAAEVHDDDTRRAPLARSERLNARITPGDQALLAKVAGLQGVSVSAFVIEAARARAKALLRRRRLIRLSTRDQKALIAALLAPPQPNAALVRAAASHAREIDRRAGSKTLASPQLAR